VAAGQNDLASHPQKVKSKIVDRFRKSSIKEWAKNSIEPYSLVVPDGLACFSEVTKVACSHEKMVSEAFEHPPKKKDFIG